MIEEAFCHAKSRRQQEPRENIIKGHHSYISRGRVITKLYGWVRYEMYAGEIQEAEKDRRMTNLLKLGTQGRSMPR